MRDVYLVDEAGFSHVGVSAQKQRPRVRVDARQTGQMLTHWRGGEMCNYDMLKDRSELFY